MLCYRRCLNGNGLFPSFKQFLENEMAKSPLIIVRKCISENLNLYLCVVIRNKSETS